MFIITITDRIFGLVHCLLALQKVEYGADSARFVSAAGTQHHFLAAVAYKSFDVRD